MKYRKPRSIREWQQMFSDIYGERNAILFDLQGLWLQIGRELGLFSEARRKNDFEGMKFRLTKVLSRLFTFCYQALLDLVILVAEKYPGVCPYCGKDEGCTCLDQHGHLDLKYSSSLSTKNLYLLSINNWQKKFKKIYGKSNERLSLIQISDHLIEEFGEACEVLLLKDREKLGREIADFFAWLMAVGNKLNISLEEILWERYPGVCSTCHQNPCQCKIAIDSI